MATPRSANTHTRIHTYTHTPTPRCASKRFDATTAMGEKATGGRFFRAAAATAAVVMGSAPSPLLLFSPSSSCLCSALVAPEMPILSKGSSLRFRTFPGRDHAAPPRRCYEPRRRRRDRINPDGGVSRRGSSGGADFDFKDIDIDDVLLQAEAALEAVQKSIPSPTEDGPPATASSPPPPIPSPPESARRLGSFDAEKAVDVLASTMGGVLWGSLLGSILAFQRPDLRLDWYTPVLAGLLLGSVGLAGSLLGEDRVAGGVVRGAFGAPTLALVNAVAGSVLGLLDSARQAARRKVESTASDIKAIPGKIAGSAQRRAAETTDEIRALPGRIVTSAQRRAAETTDEIRAIPGRIATSAQQRALEVADEVAALPQRARERVLAESDRLWAVGVVTSLIAVAILLAGATLSGNLPPVDGLL